MIDRSTDSSQNTWLDDRAVSELVGFVLVFGVILGSVGLLYATGFQAMGDYQEHEQQANAERAMEALADNFNDVVRYDGIDERSGELSLRDGTIRTGDEGTELDITVSNNGNNILNDKIEDDEFDQLEDDRLDLGEFAYTSDDERVAYEGGGVVRTDDSGSWTNVIKRPQITCHDEVAVISLVAVSGPDQSIQSSAGTEFTMTKQHRVSEVYHDVDSTSIDVVDGEEVKSCDDNDLERAIVTIVEVEINH